MLQVLFEVLYNYYRSLLCFGSGLNQLLVILEKLDRKCNFQNEIATSYNYSTFVEIFFQYPLPTGNAKSQTKLFHIFLDYPSMHVTRIFTPTTAGIIIMPHIYMQVDN